MQTVFEIAVNLGEVDMFIIIQQVNGTESTTVDILLGFNWVPLPQYDVICSCHSNNKGIVS